MYQKTTLENGVRVITEKMPQVRSVALGIIIDAGPQSDPVERPGLAHMAEHLLFQGTSSRDAREIAVLMDMGGGHMGGFTTRDYTCYVASVLDDYYTYSLDLLGDMLLNSIFPEDRLEREKAAVLREIDSERDAPDARVHNLLKAAVWPNHALGRPLTGTPASVSAITREDLIYFVHENYTPDRVIVAAAGNVEHDDFTAQVRDALWRMLGESKPRQEAPPQWETAVTINHMPVSQTYFSIAIPALPYTHPQRYDLHVLNNLLGGGISSRLYRSLREERGLVYYISSEYHAYRDAGVLVVEGAAAPEHLIPVLALTIIELGKTMSGAAPVTMDELWKAKMQIRGQHLLASEDSNTCMSRLATQELYFGRHLPAEEVVAQIENVTLDSLMQTGDTLLPGISQATVALVGPEAPDLYDQAAIESLLADFR
jgi:predicted Zn-dependent peptidase